MEVAVVVVLRRRPFQEEVGTLKQVLVLRQFHEEFHPLTTKLDRLQQHYEAVEAMGVVLRRVVEGMGSWMAAEDDSTVFSGIGFPGPAFLPLNFLSVPPPNPPLPSFSSSSTEVTLTRLHVIPWDTVALVHTVEVGGEAIQILMNRRARRYPMLPPPLLHPHLPFPLLPPGVIGPRPTMSSAPDSFPMAFLTLGHCRGTWRFQITSSSCCRIIWRDSPVLIAPPPVALLLPLRR